MPQTDERLAWAVEMLALEPNGNVLEIGCGNGKAASLVCEQLDGGTIVAIDRSGTMIARATKNNEGHISSGKAVFREVALKDLDLSNERFDAVFAFNVNVFWTTPGEGLDTLRELLTPNGRFYLFYGGWKGGSALGGIVDKVTPTLENHGFTVTNVHVKELTTAPAVCIQVEKT